MRKTSQFKQGDKVGYIPDHRLQQPMTHVTAKGIVTGTNEKHVLVRFYKDSDNKELTTKNKLCDPNNLIHLDK